MKKKLGVYGTGRIGACEATLTSGNGYPTVVIGHSEAGLERCRKTIEQNWDDLIKEGVATAANKEAAMKLVTVSNDPSLLEGCFFVFEAVAEDTSVKKEVYSAITKYAGTEVIVGSTTSSIDANLLAPLIENPKRFLITHPFQPAHMNPLVEVVKSSETSDEVFEASCCLLEDLTRAVVRMNKSVPGILVNRFAQALFRESIYLIENNVCSAEDIDKAMKYAVGMRYASIGLLEYYDDVGFELEKAIAINVYPDLCDTKEVQKITNEGIASGNKGKAAGIGLYDWSKKSDADYQRRKLAPYFEGVKNWHMPE